MRVFGAVGTAVMFLALGAVGFAQQPEGEKPRQEEVRPDHAKPEHPQDSRQAEHPQERQEPKADQRAQEENVKRAEDNAKRGHDNERRSQQQQQNNAAQDDRRAQKQNQNREEQEKRAQPDRERQAREGHQHPNNFPAPQGRPAAYHGRIPEQNFHEHFGREHHFRFHRPEIYEGRSRFQYSGYWFELVDPWPVAWGYDDDVYVDYVDDQYYLFDPVHPGARIVINVVF